MGLSQAHRIAILEEGMEIHEVGIPPEDAQFLQTRKFQVTEIARIFRVPPHMLADLEKATFSNIEHLGLEFVQHTLRPWLVRWEQAIYRDLLTPKERQSYLAEHLVDALLRGDIKSRNEAYAIGRQNGWWSANDIRKMKNQNPIAGGDVYLVPLNMVPADQLTMNQPPANDDQRTLTPYETRSQNLARKRQQLATQLRSLIERQARKMINQDIKAIRQALQDHFGQRDAASFKKWLLDYYNGQNDVIKRQFLPTLMMLAEQVSPSVAAELGQEPGSIVRFVDSYVDGLAARMIGKSLGELQGLLEQAPDQEENPLEIIEERLDQWTETRPGQIARRESVQAVNAFALAFYSSLGIKKKRWAKVGDSCPFCTDMDGKEIGLDEPFLKKDIKFKPDGADRPLYQGHDVGHGPLHKGCDCIVLAGR